MYLIHLHVIRFLLTGSFFPSERLINKQFGFKDQSLELEPMLSRTDWS